MLLSITPNVCIERTVILPRFEAGAVHRVPPEALKINAGGKGINAARVATNLGCPTLATGWVGRNQAEWLKCLLDTEGVRHDFVPVESDTRICYNILAGDEQSGAVMKTEVVEAGQPLRREDGDRLLQKVDGLLCQARMVVIGGSYPPTTPGDGAMDGHLQALCDLVSQRGCPVLVDGKGKPFELLLRGGRPPWGVKPNLQEAAEALHREIRDERGELRAVEEMLGLGVRMVLLSCGERGAHLGTPDGIWSFQPPRVREVSAVGSGDAMVGAFAATYLETGDPLPAARWGVAAGAASAACSASAFCTRSEIEAFLGGVRDSRPV